MRPESEPARRAEAQQFRGELQNDPRAREEVEAIREAGAWLDGELARSEAPVLSPERRAKLLEAANAQKRDQPTRAPVRKSRPWQRWATPSPLPSARDGDRVRDLAQGAAGARARCCTDGLAVAGAGRQPIAAGSRRERSPGPEPRDHGGTACARASSAATGSAGAAPSGYGVPRAATVRICARNAADPIGRSEAPSGESYDASTTTAKTRVSWAPTAA